VTYCPSSVSNSTIIGIQLLSSIQPSKFASALGKCRQFHLQFHLLYLKLQTTCSVRFLYHFFVRIVVIDVRWTTEISFIATLQNWFKFELFSVGFAFGWNKEQSWWFKLKDGTSRNFVLSFRLSRDYRQVYSFIQFVVN
jgi:hypothetical protein